jgi:hypothetical protein
MWIEIDQEEYGELHDLYLEIRPVSGGRTLNRGYFTEWGHSESCVFLRFELNFGTTASFATEKYFRWGKEGNGTKRVL